MSYRISGKMRRRHSRLGEQNERGFWPKRAHSVWERIRTHPDGSRSTQLPGPAAFWVLHMAALPPARRVHAQTRHPLEPLPNPRVTICPVLPEQPCFYSCYFSIPSGFILKSILLGIINFMVTLLKPHFIQPQCCRLCCLPQFSSVQSLSRVRLFANP